LEPDFARAWYELGVAYLRTGQRDEVSGVLARLEKLDPALAEELKKRLDGRQRP
jgi:hypothetical protein